MSQSVGKTAALRTVRIGTVIVFHLGWPGYGPDGWPMIGQELEIPWVRGPRELTEGIREVQILRGLRQWLLETLRYWNN